jgi:hypothetical protein
MTGFFLWKDPVFIGPHFIGSRFFGHGGLDSEPVLDKIVAGTSSLRKQIAESFAIAVGGMTIRVRI